MRRAVKLNRSAIFLSDNVVELARLLLFQADVVWYWDSQFAQGNELVFELAFFDAKSHRNLFQLQAALSES